MNTQSLKHDDMGRALLILSGLLLAGLYALVMYLIFGNLNWHSTAEQSLPYYEIAFWIIATSGVTALIIHDILQAIKSRLKKWSLGAGVFPTQSMVEPR